MTCKECAGKQRQSIYNAECLNCMAAKVEAARPARNLQELALAYAESHGHSRTDVLRMVEERKRNE